jgi:hypothetical protein
MLFEKKIGIVLGKKPTISSIWVSFAFKLGLV